MRSFCEKIVWWFGYLWAGFGSGMIRINYEKIEWNAWSTMMAFIFMIVFTAGSFKLSVDFINWAWDRIPEAYRTIKRKWNKRWL